MAEQIQSTAASSAGLATAPLSAELEIAELALDLTIANNSSPAEDEVSAIPTQDVDDLTRLLRGLPGEMHVEILANFPISPRVIKLVMVRAPAERNMANTLFPSALAALNFSSPVHITPLLICKATAIRSKKVNYCQSFANVLLQPIPFNTQNDILYFASQQYLREFLKPAYWAKSDLKIADYGIKRIAVDLTWTTFPDHAFLFRVVIHQFKTLKEIIVTDKSMVPESKEETMVGSMGILHSDWERIWKGISSTATRKLPWSMPNILFLTEAQLAERSSAWD